MKGQVETIPLQQPNPKTPVGNLAFIPLTAYLIEYLLKKIDKI
jgi:hypothetical protein